MKTFLIALFTALTCLTAQAQIAVVVNPDSSVPSMTAKEVSDLFLGRVRTLGNGKRAILLDQPLNSPLRSRFFNQLNGMDVRRLDAYWARLQFSGDVQPPSRMADTRAVLLAVRHERLAIGYIEASAVDSTVRVVLELK